MRTRSKRKVREEVALLIFVGRSKIMSRKEAMH